LAQQPGLPDGDRVMAIVGGGAHAEYARVASRMAMAVPDRLSFADAAAIAEVFVTAHEALIHLGQPTSGGWALIHAAAGGVGSAAVMLAHALGAVELSKVNAEAADGTARRAGEPYAGFFTAMPPTFVTVLVILPAEPT